MTMPADPVEDLWSSVLGLLSEDDRITPQLHGFLNLVEPKGVLAGTLYLEVPNDLTRGMLEQRIRRLMTIPGIGRLTDTTLLIDMPKLAHLDSKKIAALAGLAPMTQQSDKWHGRERI